MHMKSKTTGAAAALKKLREFAGLTLDQVAAEAGTSTSYLSSVENGRAIATTEYITRISVAISTKMRDDDEAVEQLEAVS